MGRIRNALEKLTDRLDLPKDAALGSPCIVMTGFHECTVDSHRGILEYSDVQITAALPRGSITIEGSGLQIRLMHRDRLTVVGNIERLLFHGGSC